MMRFCVLSVMVIEVVVTAYAYGLAWFNFVHVADATIVIASLVPSFLKRVPLVLKRVPFVLKRTYPLCLEHIALLLEHVPPISEARTIEAIYRRGCKACRYDAVHFLQ